MEWPEEVEQLNRYSSGYTAMGVLSFVGALVILISLVGGIAIASSGPPGMGYIGLISAVAGIVQGLLLLGVGSIGSAILDGSIAQQEMAANLAKIPSAREGSTSAGLVKARTQREPFDLKAALENVSIDADGSLLYDGYRIPMRNGSFLINGREYDSAEKAVGKILDENPSALSKYRI